MGKMKNLFEKTRYMRKSMRLIDLANTINGGATTTSVKIQQKKREVVIFVSAVGVESSNFKVFFDANKLRIIRHLSPFHCFYWDEALQVPVFSKEFILPIVIIKEKIRVFYEDKSLRIVLPFWGKPEKVGRKETRDN